MSFRESPASRLFRRLPSTVADLAFSDNNRVAEDSRKALNFTLKQSALVRELVEKLQDLNRRTPRVVCRLFYFVAFF